MKISKQRLREIVTEELQIAAMESSNVPTELSDEDEQILIRVYEAYKLAKKAHERNQEVTLGGNGLNPSEILQALQWILGENEQDDSHKFNGLGFAQSRE